MLISQLEDSTAESRAKSAEISLKTSELLAWADKFLKAAGWERTGNKRQSAMFHTIYQRGQRMVSLSGWHAAGTKGTNRNYTNTKLIFSVGDNQPGGQGPRKLYTEEQLELDIIHGTVESAESFIQSVMAYVQALK